MYAYVLVVAPLLHVGSVIPSGSYTNFFVKASMSLPTTTSSVSCAPGRTDPENGYRYYSADQLSDLNRILVLRELGLSLDQIARVHEGISPQELRGTTS